MSKRQVVHYLHIPYVDVASIPCEEKQYILDRIEREVLPLFNVIEKKILPRFYIAVTPTTIQLLNDRNLQQEMSRNLQTKLVETPTLSTKDSHTIWINRQCRFIEVLKAYVEEQRVELIATPFSGVPLPYLTKIEAIQLQIKEGKKQFKHFFNVTPKGFWFPEGAYLPGLDLVVKQEGFEYSFIYADALKYADPAPPTMHLNPVHTPHDLLMLPLHSSLQDGGNFDSPYNIQVAVLRDIQDELEQLTINRADEYFLFEELLEKKKDYERVHLCFTSLAEQQNELLVTEHQLSVLSNAAALEEDLFIESLHHLHSQEETNVIKLVNEWSLLLDKAMFASSLNTSIQQHYEMIESLYDRLVGMNSNIEEINSSNNLISNLENIIKERTQPISLTLSENKLTILMLTWEFPPNIIGGLSRHVYDISRTLVKQGHRVVVITATGEHGSNEEEMNGVEVYRVSPLHSTEGDFLKWIGGLNTAITEKAMKLCERMEFDIIHAHDWLVGASASTLKKSLELPLIVTIHATEHGRNNGIYTELQAKIHDKEQALVSEANQLIVCSDYMKEEVTQLFSAQRTPLAVIPNGIDPSTLVPNKQNDYSKYDGKRIILSLGRIVKEKGFETIIEAAPVLHEKYPDICFVIAGKGPLLSYYRNEVERRELSKVIDFIGFVSDEERNDLLSRCEVSVFPSLYEPFGIVALESMMSGKATIVSETGGLKGVVKHGISGLYIKPGDATSLIEQLSYLLENSLVSASIGATGKKIASSLFSWDRITEETVRIFQETLLNQKLLE